MPLLELELYVVSKIHGLKYRCDVIFEERSQAKFEAELSSIGLNPCSFRDESKL